MKKNLKLVLSAILAVIITVQLPMIVQSQVAASGPLINILVCGTLPNNTTNYSGPASGFAAGGLYADGLTANDLSYAIGGTGCDALTNTTEATADTVLYSNNAVQILGMVCKVSSSGSNGVTLNLRSATANLSTNVAVTIATGNTTKAVAPFKSPNVAAGATFDIRAISTEDLSAQDLWCLVSARVIP